MKTHEDNNKRVDKMSRYFGTNFLV